MANEGATQFGSIKAVLTLDKSDYVAGLKAAGAQADELGRHDPTIKVDTKGVPETIAQLKAVGAAARDTGGGLDVMAQSGRRLNDATDKVRLAEMRLMEVQERSNATASQHLSAMQALSRARRDEQDAIFSTYDGNLKLSKSNEVVARSARQVTKDVNGMGSSFKGLRDPRLIVAAVAAGMALLGPATGAATAAGVGFVGVLGTGIIALQAYKKELEEGDAQGRVMQSGLDGLKGSFGELSDAAADSMRDGVLDSIATLRTELPGLSGDVDELGGHLGKALSISTKGILTGLHTMMPLLQDGGRYAEFFAQKLADFAGSQDFKDFVVYARRELPNVGSAAMSLAVGIKDIGVALAPVGDDLIELIQLTGEAATAIAPLVSGLAKLANTPFTGIGLIGQLGKETDDMSRAAIVASPALAFLTRVMGDEGSASKVAADAVGAHTSSLSGLILAQSATATALGTTDKALDAARVAQRAHADAAAAATVQMQVEGDAAGLLRQQLDKLNGKSLSVASTQNAFDSALANSNKHIAANGKTIDRATTSLAGNSAAAVANRGELIRQVQAAEDAATAYRDNGASQDETRAKMVTMRDQILKNAKAHGLDTAEVQKFIDKIYKIPKTVPPTKLEVETAAAMKGIAAFQKAINALHGKSVTATVHYAYTGKLPNGGKSQAGGITFDDKATGGIIGYAKGGVPGYAGGTLVGPGTGTSDSILAMVQETQQMVRLSNGEFISTAASQRRNRAALEAGNKGATLTAKGSGDDGIDYERLAATIAAQMRHVVLNPVVSAGTFDRAMGGQMR